MNISPLVNEAISSLAEIIRRRIKEGNGFYQTTPGSELIAALMTSAALELEGEGICFDAVSNGNEIVFTYYKIPKRIEGLALPKEAEQRLMAEMEKDLVREFGSLEQANQYADEIKDRLFNMTNDDDDNVNQTPNPDVDPDKPYYSSDDLNRIIKNRLNNL